MLTAVDRLTKGTMAVMHEVALLRTEVYALHKANKELSKRRRAKKTRVRLGGSLTVQEAQDLLDQKAVGEQLAQETRQVVVVQGGLVRRFSVVACAASLAIMRALSRRLKNRLIHLFLIQLLLFPNVVVV